MSKRTADRDLSRLPQWARSLIDVLEKDVEYHKQRLAEALGGPEDSNTYINTFGEDDTNLPAYSRVTFRLSGGREIEVFVERPAGEYIEVRSCGRLTGSLLVQPSASNHVKIKVGESW